MIKTIVLRSRINWFIIRAAITGDWLGIMVDLAMYEIEKGVFERAVRSAGVPFQIVGAALRDYAAITHKGETVTMGGIIHGMAGNDQCGILAGQVRKMVP